MTTAGTPRACSASIAASAEGTSPMATPDSSSASNWLGVSTLARGSTSVRYTGTSSGGTYNRPLSPSTGSHTYTAAGLAARTRFTAPTMERKNVSLPT